MIGTESSLGQLADRFLNKKKEEPTEVKEKVITQKGRIKLQEDLEGLLEEMETNFNKIFTETKNNRQQSFF